MGRSMRTLSSLRTIFTSALKYPRGTTTALIREPAKPFCIIRYGIQRGGEKYYIGRLASFLQLRKEAYVRCLEELNSDREFASYVKCQTDRSIDRLITPGYLEWRGFLVQHTYAIMRTLRPRIVVETGVAAGISSAHILKALHLNGIGVLYSIDLPNYPPYGPTWVPHGLEVGYAVPPNLRSNWKLMLGDSREELPKLLKALPHVDIFLHDSLHTYEHMTFEYEIAWKALKKKGLILSDDVNANKAFNDFCRRHKANHIIICNSRFGIVQKRR